MPLDKSPVDVYFDKEREDGRSVFCVTTHSSIRMLRETVNTNAPFLLKRVPSSVFFKGLGSFKKNTSTPAAMDVKSAGWCGCGTVFVDLLYS